MCDVKRSKRTINAAALRATIGPCNFATPRLSDLSAFDAASNTEECDDGDGRKSCKGEESKREKMNRGGWRVFD